MFLQEVASVYRLFFAILLLKISSPVKRKVPEEVTFLGFESIELINKVDFSGGLQRIPTINGFDFFRYISVKILSVLRNILALQLQATKCLVKQATPSPFLERSRLIRSQLSITISLFKTDPSSFVSLIPITEAFVNSMACFLYLW